MLFSHHFLPTLVTCQFPLAPSQLSIIKQPLIRQRKGQCLLPLTHKRAIPFKTAAHGASQSCKTHSRKKCCLTSSIFMSSQTPRIDYVTVIDMRENVRHLSHGQFRFLASQAWTPVALSETEACL